MESADWTDTAGDTAALDTVSAPLPEVNMPPAVLVSSPSPGMAIEQGESVKLVGQVSDDRDAAPELACTWSSNLDGPLGSTVPLEGGLAQLVVDELSVGQHILTLEAFDSEGLRGSAQGVLLVNGAPSAPSVLISPANPLAEDDLVAELTADTSDPNRAASALTYEWRWSRNGESVSDLIGPVVPADRTSPGESWTVRVRAFDGFVFSPSSEASVNVDDEVAPSRDPEVGP